MRILLLKAKGESASKFKKQMEKWGIDLMTDDYDFKQAEWMSPKVVKDNKLTAVYLETMAAQQYKRHGKRIDIIILLIPKKYWKATSRGTHYSKPRSGYEIGAITERRNWEDSGRHESMHAFDDYVLTYLGHGLEFVVGVKDWDEDVVHGRDPRFEEYEYDRPYKAVKPYLDKAWKVRNK